MGHDVKATSLKHELSEHFGLLKIGRYIKAILYDNHNFCSSDFAIKEELFSKEFDKITFELEEEDSFDETNNGT